MPDLVNSSLNIPAAGGAACWADTIDCVAWGNYSHAAPPTVGTPVDAGGIPDGMAIRRKITGGSCTNLLDSTDDTQQQRLGLRRRDAHPRVSLHDRAEPPSLHAPKPAADCDDQQQARQPDPGNQRHLHLHLEPRRGNLRMQGRRRSVRLLRLGRQLSGAADRGQPHVPGEGDKRQRNRRARQLHLDDRQDGAQHDDLRQARRPQSRQNVAVPLHARPRPARNSNASWRLPRPASRTAPPSRRSTRTSPTATTPSKSRQRTRPATPTRARRSTNGKSTTRWRTPNRPTRRS